MNIKIMKKKIITAVTILTLSILGTHPVWANIFNENMFGFVVNSVNGEPQGVRIGLLVDENGAVGVLTVDDGVSELSEQEYEFCWYDSGSLETYKVDPGGDFGVFMAWEFVNPDMGIGYIYEPEDIWGAKLSDNVHQGQELTAVIFDYIADGTLHTVEKNVKVEDYYYDEGWDMLKISGMSLSSEDNYPIPFLNEQGDCVAIASDSQHILAFIDDETFYSSSNVSEQVMDHIDYSKIRAHSIDDDGAFYGYVEDGKMRGYGMMTFSDGDYYEGYFENGKINGLGVYTMPEEEAIKIGTQVNNSYEEKTAQLYYNDRIISIHSYENDILSGESIEISIEKDLVGWAQYAEGTMVDADFCESWEDSDGAVWYGKEKSSSLDGLGVYKKDGNIYVGEFSDGLFNGFGTVLFANGAWESGYYEDGQQKGMNVYINKSGMKQIGYWDGSDYIGNVAYYTEDGTMTIYDEDRNKLGEIQR